MLQHNNSEENRENDLGYGYLNTCSGPTLPDTIWLHNPGFCMPGPIALEIWEQQDGWCISSIGNVQHLKFDISMIFLDKIVQKVILNWSRTPGSLLPVWGSQICFSKNDKLESTETTKQTSWKYSSLRWFWYLYPRPTPNRLREWSDASWGFGLHFHQGAIQHKSFTFRYISFALLCIWLHIAPWRKCKWSSQLPSDRSRSLLGVALA